MQIIETPLFVAARYEGITYQCRVSITYSLCQTLYYDFYTISYLIFRLDWYDEYYFLCICMCSIWEHFYMLCGCVVYMQMEASGWT